MTEHESNEKNVADPLLNSVNVGAEVDQVPVEQGSESWHERVSMLGNLDIPLTIEVGRSRLRMRELLELGKGSVIELDKAAGEPVEIYANGKKIANGNIITANGKYCVRITSVLDGEK